MKKMYLLLSLTFLFLAVNLHADYSVLPASGGVIDLTGIDDTDAVIPLKGEWGFFWKQLTAEDEQPDAFIKVPGNWAEGSRYSPGGYATYYLELRGLSRGELYKLYIPESVSAYELYLRGDMIASNGTVGTGRKTSRPVFLPKTVLFKAQESSETLYLQVSNFHYRKSGIWRDLYIAPPNVLSSYYQRKILLDSFLLGLLAFVAVYHLSLYMFRKEERSALYFGLICLILFFRQMTTGEQLLTYIFPAFPWEIARRLEFLPFSAAAAFSVWYFNSLYPFEYSKRFLKVYTVIAALMGCIFILLPVRISNHFIMTGEMIIFAGLLYSLFVVVMAFTHKRNGAALILMSIGVLLVTVVNDILYSNQIVMSIYLVPYGFIFFIFTQSLMLSRRFAYSFRTIEDLTINLKDFNKSLSRFVPFQFLEYLNKNSILEVELGDQTLKNMTILFADIRSFTTLSEVMTPEENFKFLNSFLSQVVPVIREGGGFVDKFIGDGIMALFPQSTDEGLNTAVSLQRAVHKYNEARARAGYIDICLGIGLHTGGLMLGTIGESDRMETTVISDTVNIASRMEQLTKQFGASIIISDELYQSLEHPEDFETRKLGSTIVKGKRHPIIVIEILDSLSEREKELKMKTRETFEQGIACYETFRIKEAIAKFHEVLNVNPSDSAASLFISKCLEAECIEPEDPS
ncbi:MAG: adenylate/guanylate cyclase domain-containing protein [Spirochaetales bacterium]|nr:adenylate/guanylate cyclase domain-containing protein [Spirochaetales bacterium]